MGHLGNFPYEKIKKLAVVEASNNILIFLFRLPFFSLGLFLLQFCTKERNFECTTLGSYRVISTTTSNFLGNGTSKREYPRFFALFGGKSWYESLNGCFQAPAAPRCGKMKKYSHLTFRKNSLQCNSVLQFTFIIQFDETFAV